MKNKTPFKNILLTIFSTGISLLVVFLIYSHFFKKPDEGMYQGTNNEYELSFYSIQGKRISQRNGPLGLMLDPFCFFRLHPNTHTQNFFIDKNGFRGRHSYSKDKIFVVGGSAAFGYGLPSDETTFASLLEKKLGDCDVINAGVPGHLSGQELSLIVHRLDDFKPKLYIVFDGWNDIVDQYLQDWLLRRYPIGESSDFGFNHEFFIMQKKLRDYFLIKSESEKDPPEEGYSLSNEKEREAYLAAITDRYIRNISKMNSFATSRGAKVLIAFQPEIGSKNKRTTYEKDIMDNWEKNIRYLERKIPTYYSEMAMAARRYCKKNKIPFVDINYHPLYKDNEETLFYDAVHLNEKGNEIVAAILFEEIQGLLDCGNHQFQTDNDGS